MKLTWPNVLSLSRLPIAVLVALEGRSQAWGWAFGLLLAGGTTDLADGYVAKRWKLGSQFGAAVLEPVCDFALTAGAVAGLFFAHRLSLAPIIVAIVVAGLVQVINSLFTKTALFTRFGAWFMPCYYLAVIWGLLLWYAVLAMNGNVLAEFICLYVVATAALAHAKRHRFNAWFHGQVA